VLSVYNIDEVTEDDQGCNCYGEYSSRAQ
jgi:hypothetical protein